MIKFENVSKRYALGPSRGSLREYLDSLLQRASGQKDRGRESTQHLWALHNVSFRVERGEALGLVGRNGAGKTTALKLLSSITKPTTGSISINGRVAALIELGAGFHPDLTGRDNIYLYGTILGLTRKEIDQRFQRIVDFAELAPFIDTPVKRYSSGMYARLGFAVAAHTRPDVLLVDEVLAVGDANFQDKCLDFIRSHVSGGNTTVFVSHNLYATEQLCNRLIWIDKGNIKDAGNPSRVLDQYMRFTEQVAAQDLEGTAEGQGRLEIERVTVTDAEGAARRVFVCGEDLTVSIQYKSTVPIERPHFCVWVSETPSPNPLFVATMFLDDAAPEQIVGSGTIQCIFKGIPLMPRTYYVWLEVWGADRAEILYRWQRLGSFEVIDHRLLENLEEQKATIRWAKGHGPIRVNYEWRFSTTTCQEDPVPTIG